MTIQERIKAKQDDMKNAESLGALANHLRQVVVKAEVVQASARHERPRTWRLNFSVNVATGYEVFLSEELPTSFLADLRSAGNDLKGMIADILASTIADIEERAANLIGPTVTIQANGVNVEVK